MALTTIAKFKAYIGKTDNDDDAALTTLLTNATSAIEKYCDRILDSTTGREFYDGTGDYELYANNYPITAITLLSVGRQPVLRINNTDSTAWNAHVTVDATTMTLTINGGTNDGTDELTLATYTITTLAAAIIAKLKGWGATVSISDYGVWSAEEIIPCPALRCFDTDYAYVECPDEPETDFKYEANTGRLYLGTGFPIGRQNVTLKYTYGYTTVPGDLEQICNDLMNLWWQGRRTDYSLKSERLGDHWKTMAEGGHDIPDHFQKRLAPYKKYRVPVC